MTNNGQVGSIRPKILIVGGTPSHRGISRHQMRLILEDTMHGETFGPVEHRFYVRDYPEDSEPMLLNDNQSWQTMNRGKLSKRARRK